MRPRQKSIAECYPPWNIKMSSWEQNHSEFELELHWTIFHRVAYDVDKSSQTTSGVHQSHYSANSEKKVFTFQPMRAAFFPTFRSRLWVFPSIHHMSTTHIICVLETILQLRTQSSVWYSNVTLLSMTLIMTLYIKNVWCVHVLSRLWCCADVRVWVSAFKNME